MRQLLRQPFVGQVLPVLECADGGIPIIDALIGLGFAASRGEAKRLIARGGAGVQGVTLTDETRFIHLQNQDISVSLARGSTAFCKLLNGNFLPICGRPLPPLYEISANPDQRLLRLTITRSDNG